MVPTLADVRQRVALRLFALGHLQFFTAFFITKYFDFAFYASYGLLILALLQALSLWTALWQPALSRYRFALYPVYFLCLLLLSYSSPAMPAITICAAIFFLFSFVQSEIILFFKSTRGQIGHRYAAELIGGIFGCLTWYFFSAKMGFTGFVILGIVTAFLILLHEKITLRIVPTVVAAALGVVFLGAPQPLFNKRARTEIVHAGKILETRWEPNGVVELVTANPSLNLLLFDGGDLRSHIFHLTQSFEELRNQYTQSIPNGLWGLDVALPHFIQRKKSPKVALISTVGGQEILAARAFGAGTVDAIDINQSAQKIMITSQKNFSGDLYAGVNIVSDDGRHFIERSGKTYDIIQIYSSDSAAFSSAFGALLRPSSLITAEAIRLYDQHLVSDGILQITGSPLAKLVETFRLAFNADADEVRDRFLVYKRAGDSELISIAYKKSGWTPEETSRISEWLRKDPKSKWELGGLDAFSRGALRGLSLGFAERASTDNWPFFKVSSGEKFFERIGYLFLATAVLALFFWITLRKLPGRNEAIRPSFCMGVSYAMAQNLVVFLLQKQIGLPALGLSVGVAGVLVITGLAALAASSFSASSLSMPWLTPKNLARVSTVAALSLLPLFILNSALSSVPLATLIFLQSVGFTRILKRSLSEINLVLWTNGLGCMIGIFVFNLSFALLGLWQAVLVLAMIYLFIAISVRIPFSDEQAPAHF